MELDNLNVRPIHLIHYLCPVSLFGDAGSFESTIQILGNIYFDPITELYKAVLGTLFLSLFAVPRLLGPWAY